MKKVVQTILVNLDALSDQRSIGDFGQRKRDFLSSGPNRTLRIILECLSENFDIVCYSTTFNESERYEVNSWIVENNFPIEDLLLRPEHDFSKSGELISTMIETNFDLTRGEVLVIIENVQQIIDALRDEGLEVLEVA